MIRASYCPRYVVPPSSATWSSDSTRTSRRAERHTCRPPPAGRVPRRWPSCRRRPAPRAPGCSCRSAGGCRSRARSPGSRHRTGSSRPARASSVRSRVKRSNTDSRVRTAHHLALEIRPSADVDRVVGAPARIRWAGRPSLRRAMARGVAAGSSRRAAPPTASAHPESGQVPRDQTGYPKARRRVRQAQGRRQTARVEARMARPRGVLGTTPRGTRTRRKMTAPSAAPTNTVSSVRGGPRAAPTTAMSVTSPNPIASFFRTTSPSHPTIEIAPAPTHAPISASYGIANQAGVAPTNTRDEGCGAHPQQAEDREPVGDHVVLQIGDRDTGENRPEHRHPHRRER